MPITKSESSFTLDLEDELRGVPRSKHKAVKKQIGDTLIESMLKDMDSGRSSVTGTKWPGLSSEYRAIKKKLGKGTTANLKLNNDMRPAIKSRNTIDGVKLDVSGRVNKLKSFNHNKGDTLSQRQFMPDDSFGQTFRPGILRDVKAIIRSNRDLELIRKQRREDAGVVATESTEDPLSVTFDVDAFLEELLE